MCDEKWIVHNNQWWPAGPRRNYKALPKSQACTKKKKKKVHGHCLVVCCPSDPLPHLRSMLSKSIRCTENCNACTWHWSIESAQFFSKTMSNHTSHNKCFKNWMIGLRSFGSSAIFTWSLANWWALPQASQWLFAGKTLPQPAGCRKCFPSIHSFYAMGINELITHWQKCVDCNDSY